MTLSVNTNWPEMTRTNLVQLGCDAQIRTLIISTNFPEIGDKFKNQNQETKLKKNILCN